jgi:signal transduction histidine kinase
VTLRRRLALLSLVVGLLLGLLVTRPAAAGPDAVSIAEGGFVGSRAEVLEDPSGTLVPEAVAAATTFTRIDPARANHGYTSATFWVRLTLENPAAEPAAAIVELAATPWVADLFDASGTELLARSGARLPFPARPVSHSNIAFRTVLTAHQTRTFLVRIASHDTMIVNPIVWREEAFWSAIQQRRLLDGLYYGIILGLALYNLFLAVATKDRAYLAYVGFQVGMALANGAIDKYTFQFLWPQHPVWAERSEQALIMFALGAAMMCARRLLDTPRLTPRTDRVLRALSLVAFAAFAVTSVIDAPPLALFAIAAFFFVGIAMLVLAASLVARTGSPHGRIFLVAWSLLFAGTFAAGLAAVGVIQSLAGYDLLKVGSAAEALLLSIGLAARIRTMQRDRASAREALLLERARRIDSLSRLVAGVAHEIGNPLNFAKGGAGALGTSLETLASGEPRSEKTERAASSARRALGLVEGGLDRIGRMLKHLRSDLGDRQAHASAVIVDDELSDAIELLEAWLAARGVVLAREPERGAAALSVLARSGDLAQVFGNVLRNAGDAMPGGGTVRVTLAREATEAVITFRDDGPGVPADLQASIFEPFFTTRAGEEAGTGLGLYVSREIVARWGGSLSLVAQPGPGATFVVRLPLAERPAD